MFSSKRDSDEDPYDFNANMDIGSKPPMTSAFRNAPGTSASRPLVSSMGKNFSSDVQRTTMQSRMGGTVQAGSSDARPMTSVSGAGYKGNAGSETNRNFDPFNIGKGPAPPLAEKSENSAEDKAKEMEKGVHRLIEASAECIAGKELLKALEKAKEAGKAERALCKFRESNGLTEHINLDLTYAICFNLANAYYHNRMYEEALNTYQLIIKNKQYPQSGRLRVNMGNIYYDQKKYTLAIKMYRMALDQIPSTGKELRFRILKNIGNAFIKLGQFQDSIDSYETIMAGSAEINAAFNLLLCLYARGDKEKIKRHFVKMLTIPIQGMTEEDEEKVGEGAVLDLDLLHVERLDNLKEELARRKEQFNDRILLAARIVAPVIFEDDWEGGYKWVMEQLRHDHETVASKLEIDLAMMYMKKRKFEVAIDVLKAFERKDPSLRAMAGTNLSFIYFLEGDYQQADAHADLAIRLDRYNAKALVNKGNCQYMAGDYGRAKEMYLEAVGVEADCVEAIFNLGLVNVKLNALEEAHHAFDKLHTILPSVPEALFQLGAIYDMGTGAADLSQAAKTFEMLLSKVPGDPNLCSRLAQVYEKLDDENTACHWHSESHRHYPVNLNVISWLGVWFVKREMYEQAIEYFERASLVQPGEVKWRLMVTSCYRRLGDFHKALELYQHIHEDHPENIESLQYLEALCKDLGRPHDEYSRKLDKLRRSQPQQQQQQPTQVVAASTQRTERPSQRPERPQRPERVSSGAAESKDSGAALDGAESGSQPTNKNASPLAAPRAVAKDNYRGPARPSAKVADDDDDFADTDVTDLLSPRRLYRVKRRAGCHLAT